LQISEGKAFKNENLILKINIIMKTKMSNYRNCFALAYVLLVAVFFVGCETTHRNNTQKTESGIPLCGRYEVVENKMKYIVYRNDGGLFVINLTKDSLEVAFYRQRLVAPK